MNEHTSTEAPREYGELYYSADSVATLLRVVAELLEGDKRRALLRLSHDLPTTMPWHDFSGNVEQSTYFSSVSRHVQFGLQHDALFGSDPLRLTCLLRRGPINQRPIDGEHVARMVSQS